ncbi:MAG: hypothetical protein K2J34_10395 [Muribaculaceae bacterium]|nr:hypothetical protein [Muribaculaceae bacterium]
MRASAIDYDIDTCGKAIHLQTLTGHIEHLSPLRSIDASYAAGYHHAVSLDSVYRRLLK